MPHGYECDRCETFVPQEGEFGRTFSPETEGPVEEVRILPPTDADDFALNHYTLCDDCRDTIIAVIESGQGVGL